MQPYKSLIVKKKAGGIIKTFKIHDSQLTNKIKEQERNAKTEIVLIMLITKLDDWYHSDTFEKIKV